jgi:sugar lactone lactonase YvrE
VDIEGKCFHRLYLESNQLETYQVGQPVGCLAFHAGGGLVLALQEGLGLWDWSSEQVELTHNPEKHRRRARFNDGRVDSRGRLWVGTMGDDPQSQLYRLDPDGSLHVMETGISISNGIGWSPDDQVMYYTDSPRRVIYAYDFDPDQGVIENRRNFAVIPENEGVPDGLTVDSQGFVWSAQWDGWRVTRYDPDGRVERVISMPIQRPTSCAFGGSNLDQLFITSASTGLSQNELTQQPFAGDLFLVDTDFQGQKEHFFGG